MSDGPGNYRPPHCGESTKDQRDAETPAENGESPSGLVKNEEFNANGRLGLPFDRVGKRDSKIGLDLTPADRL